MSKPTAPSPFDAFAGPPPSIVRTPCKTGALIASLDDAAAAALNAALHPDSGWKNSQIASRLRDLGYQVREDNISRHRRRLTKTGEHCECPA